MTTFQTKAQELARVLISKVEDPEVAQRLARQFLQEAFKIGEGQWIFWMQRSYPEDEEGHYHLEQWVHDYMQHDKPLSRSLQKRFFWKDFFVLNEATLDPRPETEGLIELILNLGPRKRVLDLGTGSGCILLSLLQEWPEAWGLGVDCSALALQAAEANGQRLGLESRVQWQKTDWFSGVQGRFDVIVSNPPYIPSSDLERLDEAVRRWDPVQALDGGKDGLEWYRLLAQGSHLFLAGYLFLEIGYDQGPAVMNIFGKYFQNCELKQDLAGRDRYVVAF